MLLFGSTPRVLTIASEYSTALMLNALRCGIAAVVLLALMATLRQGLPRGETALWLSLSGLLFVAYVEGFAEAIVRAGAGNAAVLASTSPLFVLVFGRLFLAERVPMTGVVGLIVGIAGATLMVSSELGGGGWDLVLGMLLALCASAAAGANILLVKWRMEVEAGLDVLSITAIQLIVAGGMLVPIAFAVDGADGTEWSSGELWTALVFLGVGGLVVGTLAFFAALRRLPATSVSASLILVPVVAVLIETARGNRPGGIVLIGMVLAVAGVALVIFRTQLPLEPDAPTQPVTDLAARTP